MRLGLFGLALLATSATAQASSIVVVAPPEDGDMPSVVRLEAATPLPDVVEAEDAPADDATVLPVIAAPGRKAFPTTMRLVSRSVLAMRGAEPPVTSEKVAAIGGDRPVQQPVVIRGGMSGGASAAVAEAVTLPQQPAQKMTSRERKRLARKEAAASQPVAAK